MDFIRMALVYPHLIACCVAIGLILTSDIALIKQLFSTDTDMPNEHGDMATLQKTVQRALIALWITGIAIISLDMWSQGFDYLRNPKLQAKVAIVTMLTMNGVVLHKAVLPALQRTGSLLGLPVRQRIIAMFAGVVSGVSWFYAAMLGIGRPLNWKYSLFEILAAYPVFIVGGFATMLLLTAWAKSRSLNPEPFTDEEPAF